MEYYVAVTDNAWFRFLAQLQPDEVNFWRPGGGTFRVVRPGAPFLFKLHSPLNYITGGGFFIRYTTLPLSLAWEAFGEKNGASALTELYEQIRRYRASRELTPPDPEIGCVILAQPFFFREDEWIPAPQDWHPSIVQGKRYDTRDPVGAKIWDQVRSRLGQYDALFTPAEKQPQTPAVGETRERYGAEVLTRTRLGQGAFRVLVTDAYGRRCAVTGERTLPVLQAAHIKPYTESGPHRVDNGLLLRADLHILFDRGYVTVTRDLRVEVSHRIREDFENGEHYYAMHGRELAVVPRRRHDRPSSEFVEWHNQRRFLG
jgi:putative restriction endonuclease